LTTHDSLPQIDKIAPQRVISEFRAAESDANSEVGGAEENEVSR